MADDSLKIFDLEQPNTSGHSVYEESDDDGANKSIPTTSSDEDHRLSPQPEQRRTTCRYFDNYDPRTMQIKQVLLNDYFYQEHHKTCHYSVCEPLPAPHNDLLPEEPPLRAEAPISLMAPHLRPVKLRDKLLSPRHIRLVGLHLPGHPDDSQRYSLRPQARRLRCEVYQASLDEISSDGEPKFAALSYVCGSPTLTQHVWCAQTMCPRRKTYSKHCSTFVTKIAHVCCGLTGSASIKKTQKRETTKSACYMRFTARHMS
jgi:hypothetical protein